MQAQGRQTWTEVRQPRCRCGSGVCARARAEVARRRDVILDAQEVLFDEATRPSSRDPVEEPIEGLLTWRVAAA